MGLTAYLQWQDVSTATIVPRLDGVGGVCYPSGIGFSASYDMSEILEPVSQAGG